MAAGAVLYPLCWALEAWLIWRVLGPWVVLVFAVLLIPSGLLALAWRERLDRVARQARAFFRFLGERDLHQKLMAERRALVDEVRALAARVLELGQQLARRMKELYKVERAAFFFTGTDVAHAHAHVVPIHEKMDVTSARYITSSHAITWDSAHLRADPEALKRVRHELAFKPAPAG